MPAQQPWFVFRFNHFDPTWRRCWDRDFVEGGRRFRSYRAIEELWIDTAIATCADGVSCFMVECSWVLRHYLERHPEQRETLRQLAREGRFELLGSGETIVDANLIHGETLARNLLLGTLWGEETLGARPTTGFHSDGFGSSAQMPQIFRQCGYDWFADLSYARPDRPFWRGLDGSTIYYDTEKRLSHRQGTRARIYQKLPPCPHCQGHGCPACDGHGMVIGQRAELTALPDAPVAGQVGVLMLWGEEIQPGLHVADAVAQFNADSTEMVVRQGIYRDLRPFIADRLAQVDNPPASDISSRCENNPSQSGCYVSRIKMKQEHRRSEHALLAAECWDALLSGGAAAGRLRDAWRILCFAAFHDAVTSSHCDQAYDELLDLHAEMQATAATTVAAACTPVLSPRDGAYTIFNHHDFPATTPVTLHVPGRWSGATAVAGDKQLPVYAVAPGENSTAVTVLARDVPPLGACSIDVREAPAAVPMPAAARINFAGYTLDAGEHGITAVEADGLGAVAATADYLFGELLLEHDDGDPWATRSLDRTRVRLSPYTRRTGIAQSANEVTVTYTGRHPANDDPHFCDDPHVTWLTWGQTFRLRTGLPWMTVETQVEWYTHSRRLRLAFPSALRDNRGLYEIPYGVLARDRYEGTTNYGGNAGGDWPALHWAGLQAPAYTFAVFNQGTPSYRIEEGAVLVSVLRSPQLPYGLFEPESYTAYNYYGMHDHGTHRFTHALYIGRGDWRENATGAQAALFNSGLTTLPGALAAPPAAWAITSAHSRLATVKHAENGRGVILRLVETAGNADTVTVCPPPHFTRARLCNLLEDDGAVVDGNDGAFRIPLKPWEIATVRLVGE